MYQKIHSESIINYESPQNSAEPDHNSSRRKDRQDIRIRGFCPGISFVSLTFAVPGSDPRRNCHSFFKKSCSRGMPVLYIHMVLFRKTCGTKEQKAGSQFLLTASHGEDRIFFLFSSLCSVCDLRRKVFCLPQDAVSHKSTPAEK